MGSMNRFDGDRRIREIYHPRPKVVLADNEWVSFSVNRNWIDPIAAYNSCLSTYFNFSMTLPF